MPQIYDNIEKRLMDALSGTLGVSQRADFCIGYFNLKGWRQLDSFIEGWSGGENHCYRLLIGMQKLEQDEFRDAKSLLKQNGSIDNQTALRPKKKLAQEFRDQLTIRAPTRMHLMFTS